MGAPLEIERADYTSAEPRALSNRNPDGAQVRRILAAAMVLEGRSRTEAAEFNGMDRQTLRDWVRGSRRRGPPGASCSSRRGTFWIRRAALSASSSSHAWRKAFLTDA